MWIISQNKEVLINANEVRIVYEDTYCIVCDYYDGELYYLGEYSTKEKALKVMNLMEHHIRCLESYKLHIFEPLNRNDCFIFYMPTDDEVEV